MYFVFLGNNILEAKFCILFTSTLLSTPESAERIEGSKGAFRGSHLRLYVWQMLGFEKAVPFTQDVQKKR